MGVTHALWGAIRGALDDSRYFIVLASPDAAASRWVNQEIDWCGDEVAAIAGGRSATVWSVAKPDIPVNPGDVEIGMTAWKQEACQIANRNLSVAEWSTLIGADYKYRPTCPGLPREP